MKKNLLAFLVVTIASVGIISLCTQETTTSNLVYLHEQHKLVRSDQEHLNRFAASGDVVVIFYADWCNPCKRMSPLIEAVAILMPNITFIKINRDYFQDLAKSYTVNSIPTLIFLRDGKEIGRYEAGPLTEKKLKKLIASVYND